MEPATGEQTGAARRANGTERLRALQNPLDRWLYHPLAARLARMLARSPVTPNMVSVGGALAIVLAGIAYIQPGWPLPALAGLAIHMGWHVLDGADGDLARLTGRSSPAGEIIDGICDYSGHFLLYLLLAMAAWPQWGWVALALPLAAGLSRIAQASFHEAQRRQYLSWIRGVPWLRQTQPAAEASRFGWLGRAYLAVAGWLAPAAPDLDRAFADPEQGKALRRRLEQMGPTAMAGKGLLGANYRTLALGASMLAGSPLYYFLYEVTVLNLLLIHAAWRARQTLARLRG